MIEDDANPMHKAHTAPRCTAHSKRTGAPCHCPAVTGWRVCRMHGAGGGHPAGKAHPSWRHGLRSREWIYTRHQITSMIREARELAQQITG